MPVVLGCCPHPPRCLLCPPPTPRDAAYVDALVHALTPPEGGAVRVRFFGGAPPDDALLAAAAPHPVGVRVRPDLLSRSEAERLVAAGVTEVELDALSFHAPSLRAAGRTYSPAWLEQQTAGLLELGLTVGGVLTPGLPGQAHAHAVQDAVRAARCWSFVRIHPVLVLDGSGLHALHAQRRYTPLRLGEAVTVARDMADVLDAAGVAVRRIGLQPGPDGFGRAVAGPIHPSLRELVEARRALDRLRSLFVDVPRGATVTVACAPADQSRTRGALNANVRTLRAELGLCALHVVSDATLGRGAWRVHVHEEIA